VIIALCEKECQAIQALVDSHVVVIMGVDRNSLPLVNAPPESCHPPFAQCPEWSGQRKSSIDPPRCVTTLSPPHMYYTYTHTTYTKVPIGKCVVLPPERRSFDRS
jgi:hypothetical protein